MTESLVLTEAPLLRADLAAAVLLVDKPQGWTSFDVVRKLRRLLKVRKIGHAGTLDPMATGLLVCLVGRATKKMEHFMHLSKVYEGTLRLGEETPSYDAETPVCRTAPWEHVTNNHLLAIRPAFLGEITQIPPMYSAVKVAGERLYKKARRGETVERRPNLVRIDRLDFTARSGRSVSFEVECSKGTYIRTLAHDIGYALRTAAHLTSLRRLAIGPYSVEEAWQIDVLEAALSAADLPKAQQA